MNRLLPLIGMMVLVAALTGAAIGWMGWRPFTARRATNQLDANKENPTRTGNQTLKANQPTKTAQNNQSQRLGATGSTTGTQSTTAQAPDTTVTQGTSDSSQPVPALW
jgi:hypothetical protein